MDLLRVLLADSGMSRWRLAGIAALSALGNALALAAVNRAAAELARGDASVDGPLAVAFVAVLGLYAVGEVTLIARVCRGLETAVDRLRRRILERMAAAGFEALERIGPAEFHENLIQGARTISQNSQFLALGARSAALIPLVVLYIAWISPVALALALVTTALASVVYHRAGREAHARLSATMNEEKRLFEGVSDLLDGFKEVRLNSARGRDLATGFADISDSASRIRFLAQDAMLRQMVLGQVAVFLLLAVVVFVMPAYVPAFGQDLSEVAIAALFLCGPVGALIQVAPLLGASGEAAARMRGLERELAAAAEPAAATEPPAWADFREITLREVAYVYPSRGDEAPFGLGPLDLTLRRGEIVFVTGGNGSGKSTLIKLLTGLYPPRRGVVLVDGAPVRDDNRRAYRDLIAPVFSDGHLFPRLYGVAEVDPAEAARRLDMLGMGEKVRVAGDRFDRLDLSSGQRKRLALVAALLERRPVLVLDEWAADQDPGFRRRFYREILPALRAEGLTVLAVTHDDAYFDVADRCLRLEEGRLAETRRPPEEGGTWA